MFFKKRGGAGQEKKRERKRERVIRFLDEIFKSHDLSNILLEYLKSHLRQLPPEVKDALKEALGVPPARKEEAETLPERPKPHEQPREHTFQEIDDLIFERIKDIVSHASPDEKFSQGFAEHKLVLDNQEKPLSDVILKDFDFPMVFNLIRRIQQELNQEKSFEEEPNLEALMAMEGLIYILMEKRKEQPTSNPDEELNLFITCCFNDEIKNMSPKQRYESVITNLSSCSYRMGNAWYNPTSCIAT